MARPDPEITRLLEELHGPNKVVVDSLLPVVYDELKRLARSRLRGERGGHTLNATALVHEAYARLVDQDRMTWKNRAHFFAVAARAMRRILIDHARHRQAQKRGAGTPVATFDENETVREARAEELIALDEALAELADKSERESKVVELSFFVGLTHEEIAEVLGTSTATVGRDLRIARAWLARRLKDGPS